MNISFSSYTYRKYGVLNCNSMTDCVGKFCKQLSNGLCNVQLAIGNLQLV